MSDETTLAELFARDPFDLSKLDINRIIEHYIGARQHFKLSGKPLSAKVDSASLLKELGLT